jgi:hypothetical protein
VLWLALKYEHLGQGDLAERVTADTVRGTCCDDVPGLASGFVQVTEVAQAPSRVRGQ